MIGHDYYRPMTRTFSFIDGSCKGLSVVLPVQQQEYQIKIFHEIFTINNVAIYIEEEAKR